MNVFTFSNVTMIRTRTERKCVQMRAQVETIRNEIAYAVYANATTSY